MTFKVPYLNYENVREHAKIFLSKYHPSLKLPVPIEWIIESDLGLHIHPFPNLYRIFRQSGFLSHDRKVIYIDEYQYDNFVEKYRFTLAHEVGHFVMHKSLYEDHSFGSVQEYIDFLQSIPQKELYWFETQGDWFAGQILVPTERLNECCVSLLESNRERFADSDYLSPEFWSYASNALAEIFEVNPIVVEIRIRNESLSEAYKDYYQKTSKQIKQCFANFP
jgi:hypothetical protein